jgi:hypothetical protein
MCGVCMRLFCVYVVLCLGSVVWYDESQSTFRRNMASPSSGSRNKPRKNKCEAGTKQGVD